MNTKERVIKFLLSKEREYNNNKLSVDVGRNSFFESEISDIGEDEFINQISILETEGLIKVNFRTAHRDLKYFITIDLLEPILNYFDNKKSKTKSNRREWVRTYLPITISGIALLKSFSPEIVALWEAILKLLKQL